MAAAGAVRASFSPVAACAGTPCLRARSHVAASAWPAADAAWIAASALAGSSAWGHAATVWTSCMRPAPAMMRRSSAFCAGVPGLSSGTMARRRSTSARSQSRAIMRPRKTSGAFLQTKPTTERSARGTTRLPSTSSTFASPMPRSRWRASMRRPRSKQASAVLGSRLVEWRSACHALTTAARNRSSNTVASNSPSCARRRTHAHTSATLVLLAYGTPASCSTPVNGSNTSVETVWSMLLRKSVGLSRVRSKRVNVPSCGMRARSLRGLRKSPRRSTPRARRSRAASSQAQRSARASAQPV